MSNTTNIYRCPSCGRLKDGEGFFCPDCGARLVAQTADTVESEYNDVKVLDESAIDTVESASLPVADEPSAEEPTVAEEPDTDSYALAATAEDLTVEETPAKMKDMPRQLKVARRTETSKASVLDTKGADSTFGSVINRTIALLLVSLILFVGFFIPFVKAETTYGTSSSYEVSFSPYEMIKITIRSGQYLSTYQLKGTEEYSEYSHLKSQIEYYASVNKLGSRQEALMQDYTKAALKVHLMSRDTVPKGNLIGVGLMAMFFMLLASVALILAVISVCLYLTGKVETTDALLKYVRSLVAFMVTVIPCYLLTFLQASHFSYGFEISNFADRGVSLTFFGVVMLLVYIGSMLYMCARCIAYLRKKESKKGDNTLKRQILALVCILIAAFSIFLPVMSVETAALRGKNVAEQTFWFSSDEIYELSYYDVNHLTVNTTEYAKTDFEAYVAEVARNGDTTNSAARSIFYYIAFRYSYGAETICVIMAICYVLSAYVLSLFAMRMFSHILSKQPLKGKKFLMFMSVFSTVLNLSLAFALTGICNMFMPDSTAQMVVFSVSFGPILSLVATLVAVIVLVLHDKVRVSREYDNPDVSYDPYVV